MDMPHEGTGYLILYLTAVRKIKWVNRFDRYALSTLIVHICLVRMRNETPTGLLPARGKCLVKGRYVGVRRRHAIAWLPQQPRLPKQRMSKCTPTMVVIPMVMLTMVTLPMPGSGWSVTLVV